MGRGLVSMASGVDSLKGNHFDQVALEYHFMAELFHSPDFFLNNLPNVQQLALDLGCGSGLITSELAQHFDQVIGVDLSAELLQIAHHKTHQANVLYAQMDISQLGCCNGFDLIISKGVFHHLDDLEATILQIQSLLKSGGRLIITDVISNTETPPRYIYLIGAMQEYLPNVMKFDLKTANRIYRFRTSKQWLAHLASDRYLSPISFEQTYSRLLPNCRFPKQGHLIWDKP